MNQKGWCDNMKKRKIFHYIPKIVEYDIVIDEENLVKAWKKALNTLQTEGWFNEAKSLPDFQEENILWDILCEATQDDDYPVFEIQPCGSDDIYAYTIIEIEEQFNTDFYNFCWRAVEKIAYDLGLLY